MGQAVLSSRADIKVADFPGKADHYKMCLGIIAGAQGEERPGLQSFVQTGSRGECSLALRDPSLTPAPDPPPRKDLPVGLHNIG